MKINLLVLRTDKPKALVEFYGALGIEFDYHKHGHSPMHYSGKMADLILEIYPLAKGQEMADKHLRIGFEIDNFETVVRYLKTKKVTFISEPSQSDFGYMAIIEDSDGRKVELYKETHPIQTQLEINKGV